MRYGGSGDEVDKRSVIVWNKVGMSVDFAFPNLLFISIVGCESDGSRRTVRKLTASS